MLSSILHRTNTFSIPPRNLQKTFGFLTFSEGIEKPLIWCNILESINPFQPSDAFHIETGQLIFTLIHFSSFTSVYQKKLGQNSFKLNSFQCSHFILPESIRKPVSSHEHKKSLKSILS